MTQSSDANAAFTMPPIDHARDLRAVVRILEDTPAIDREYMAPREEFEGRARRVSSALQSAGHAVGFVFSDEHYRGDVPYLGGNTNLSIEQVAGVVGKAFMWPRGSKAVTSPSNWRVAKAGSPLALRRRSRRHPRGRGRRLERGARIEYLSSLTAIAEKGVFEWTMGLEGSAGGGSSRAAPACSQPPTPPWVRRAHTRTAISPGVR